MADERATITVTLVDEASDGLQNISKGFEEVRRGMQQASQESAEFAQRSKRSFSEMGEGVNRSAQSMLALREFSKGVFVEFTKNVLAAEAGLGRFQSALVSVGSVMIRASTLIGGTTGAVAGLGAAAVATVVGIDALARSMARAEEHARALRTRYGETTDNFIKFQERIGSNIGQTTEQTLRQLDQFSRRYHDVVYGTQSELYRMLSQYGEAGEGIFRQLEQAQQRGVGAAQALQQVGLAWFDRQKTEVQAREVAKVLGIPYEQLKRLSEEAKESPPPWMPSRDQQEAYDENMRRLTRHLNRIRSIWEDHVSQTLWPIQQRAGQLLEGIYKRLETELPKILHDLGEAWKEAFGTNFTQSVINQLDALARDLKTIFSEIRTGIEWILQKKREIFGTSPMPTEPPVTPGVPRGPVPPGYNEVPPDWKPGGPQQAVPPLWRQYPNDPRIKRRNVPQRFGGMGDDLIEAPAPGTRSPWDALHGGYSTNIEDRRPEFAEARRTQEEIAGDSRQQSEYLRQIRDDIAWIKDQAMGGEAAGGQAVGFGGGAGGGYGGGQGGGAGGGDGGRGGGGGGRGGGRESSPQGGADTHPLTGGLRLPTSPQDAPETMEDAIKRGFMPPGGWGGAGGDGKKIASIPGADISGRQTWFNPYPYTYRDPKTGETWTDYGAMKNREGPHASGLPITTPGFAAPGRKGLGGWYELTLPDGRKVITQKTDIGPRGVIDLNAALASQAYGSRAAATKAEGRITGRYLGQNLPEGVTPGIQGRDTGTGTVLDALKRMEQGGDQYAGGQPGQGQRYNYFQSLGQGPPSRGSLQEVQTPFGKILAHPQAAEDFRGFYNELAEQGAPIKRLGSYNYRRKRWGGGWSSHAYGTATDLDDEQYLSPAMRQWIARNPDQWERIKAKWNMGQPLPSKDPAHIEWRGKPRERREADRAATDKPLQSTAAINGKISVGVDVKAPRGTTVKAKADGPFEPIQMNKTAQMAPAGATEDSPYAEE